MIYGSNIFGKSHRLDIPIFLFIMLQVALGLYTSSKFIYWFLFTFVPQHVQFS